MVALSTSLACRSFELDGIATSAEETYEHGQSAKLLQGNETTVVTRSGYSVHKGRGVLQ